MDEISMSEQLSFMDMLQPWPHHLTVLEYGEAWIAACDCGWFTDTNCATPHVALGQYQAHIERVA